MKQLFIIIMLSPMAALAQGELSTRDGKIFYEFIDSAAIGSADDLYRKAKLWYVESFKSANAVIQLDEKERHTIIGKGFFSFLHNLQPYEVWFTAKVITKDNKYRAQFYSVSVTAGNNRAEVPGEWFIEKKGRRVEREKIGEGFSALMKSIKKIMSSKEDSDF